MALVPWAGCRRGGTGEDDPTQRGSAQRPSSSEATAADAVLDEFSMGCGPTVSDPAPEPRDALEGPPPGAHDPTSASTHAPPKLLRAHEVLGEHPREGTLVYLHEGAIWLSTADGLRRRRLVAAPPKATDGQTLPPERHGSPQWTPGGQSIVFATTRGEPRGRVALLERRCRKVRWLGGVLCRSAGLELPRIAVTPDGFRLAPDFLEPAAGFTDGGSTPNENTWLKGLKAPFGAHSKVIDQAWAPLTPTDSFGLPAGSPSKVATWVAVVDERRSRTRRLESIWITDFDPIASPATDHPHALGSTVELAGAWAAPAYQKRHMTWGPGGQWLAFSLMYCANEACAHRTEKIVVTDGRRYGFVVSGSEPSFGAADW